MKKLFSLTTALLFFQSLQAQIMLSPIVDSSIGGLTDNNVSIIENRLRSVISSLGMESGYGGRFVLACKVTALQREVVGSKLAQHLEVTMAIGDNQANACFGSTSMEVFGVGDTEGLAMTSALKNIKATPKLKMIVAEAKQRIIDYYNQNCGAIIQKARTLQTSQSWEEALYELSAIPQEVSCYTDALSMMDKIYVAHLNHDAQQILNQAQAIWAADPNPGWGAEEAMRILGQINTGASCYPQAQALMRKIETRVKGVTDKRYNDAVNMEKARLNAQTALEKARINACRDVAVAWAKRRTVIVRNYYRTWW